MINIKHILNILLIISLLNCSSIKNKYGYEKLEFYGQNSPTYQKEFYAIFILWGIGQEIEINLEKYCGKRIPHIQTYYPDFIQIINLISLDIIHIRSIRIECY
jgi:hypothetical protein